ncbi:MAG: 16S rRNA (adenine(1518)-N(6)/adenine(1519)-N(6))-dimethyltransferase RsmA [Desulfurococcaceae archaeon]
MDTWRDFMGSLSNPLELGRSELVMWTRKVLREYGLRPRKSLSQNFIVDPLLIRELINYTGSGKVLEIGCGIGTLTRAVLLKAHSLTCIEIDWRLCEAISGLVDSPFFVIVNGDARFLPYLHEEVISNAPYHITSDLIVKISRENCVNKAVLTLQREVADRLLSLPGSKNYGKITVLVNVLFDVKAGGTYPPGSFFPKPGVYHRVVVLLRRRSYAHEIEVLERITKKAFSQRKRLLSKVFVDLLKVNPSDLGPLWSKLEGKRVFAVDPETWLEISRSLLERGINV